MKKTEHPSSLEKVQAKLEDLLVEGIHSGEATEMTREDWSYIRAEALKQFEAR